MKAHNAIWEAGGCLTPFICSSITKIGLQAKMACGSEIRKNPKGLLVWMKGLVCVFFLTKALFLNQYQSTDSKALHDAGIRPNPGKKKAWHGAGGEALQKFH